MTTPRRFITLHLSHLTLTEALTFMINKNAFHRIQQEYFQL